MHDRHHVRATAGAADVHLTIGLPPSGHAHTHQPALHLKAAGGRRGYLRPLQALLLLCLLLPLWAILSWGRPGRAFRSAGRSRKMLGSGIPLAGERLKRLIVVAGHGVYVGTDFKLAGQESSWFLEDYQKVPGEAESFLEHIRLGIEAASKDREAMLLFSGGQTRLEAGPRSEGLSYWVVAEAAGWFGFNATSDVRARTFTEEHARDSFENLLFAICRFYELSGHYPEAITVISYSLKRARFEGQHRAALRWPLGRFSYIGTQVPTAAEGAERGEARTVAAFHAEPYGCRGELLMKRLRRDPFSVGPIHPSRCPDLEGLLRHCKPVLYSGALPWA